MPDTFVSYAWADTDVAAEIDASLQSLEITILRDVRDVGFRGKIKDFMHSVGKGDRVVMLISDAYLRSDNCMYEVTELLNTPEMERRILPIILPTATGISGIAKREDFYDFWKKQLDACELLYKEDASNDALDDLKKHQKIIRNLPAFFDALQRLNVLSLDALKAANYQPMLDFMGVKDSQLSNGISSFETTDGHKDLEINFDDLLKQAMEIRCAMIQSAQLQTKKGDYHEARVRYNKLLETYPACTEARTKFACLLSTHFKEHREARRHYEHALRINSGDADTNFNYAILLLKAFSDVHTARKHYLAAIKCAQTYRNPYFEADIGFFAE